MSIAYDLQGEPAQKEIVEAAIIVLEREQV